MVIKWRHVTTTPRAGAAGSVTLPGFRQEWEAVQARVAQTYLIHSEQVLVDPIASSVGPGQFHDLLGIEGTPDRFRGQGLHIKDDKRCHGGPVPGLPHGAGVDEERSPFQSEQWAVGLSEGHEVELEVIQEVELPAIGIEVFVERIPRASME